MRASDMLENSPLLVEFSNAASALRRSASSPHFQKNWERRMAIARKSIYSTKDSQNSQSTHLEILYTRTNHSRSQQMG